ncbi:MAG: flavin reductase family protein [Gammaproteobacteria bacterium]|nr:flavin reductase family protein [Gammaproteobacteria bacterium]
MTQISEAQFRQAMGQFATGVTIVTCANAQARPVAMTVNSFTSVSANPPLILWCVNKTILPFPAFHEAAHFAIHVLHAGQQDMSNHFAVDREDKFSGIDYTDGIGAVPTLKDFLALYQCETHARFDAGDHVIIVGRVLSCELRDGQPLLFHGGGYRELAATPA